jgi:catechol 2,3-dioxygenase-like lactoylglutathione lyase family enzyme
MVRLIVFLMATTAFAQTPDVVVGVGTFIHVVADLDKTIRFYGDGLGLEMTGAPGPRAFSVNAVVEGLYDAKGSQSRVAVFKIPGSPLGLEFVEFKDIPTKAFRPQIQEPGASILTLSVEDVNSRMAKVREAGALLTSRSRRDAVTVQDPDGFYVQLVSNAPGTAPALLALITDDSHQTSNLFHDLLGFQFSGNTGLSMVPGTQFPVQFVPFKRIGPQSRPHSIHDPGAGVLRLQARDVDALLATLKAANVPVASAGGNPVSVGSRHFVILRDPDSFFFQLVPQAQNLTAAPK